MRALIYIIDALATLVTFVFLLRFWLPWFGADFRNPIAQGLLKATSPIINPLRRIVPSIGRIDTATILVLILIQVITLTVVLLLAGATPTAKFLLLGAMFELIHLSVQLFMFAIIIRIVLSWIAPQTYNSATLLLANITDPLLRPFRRYIPPIGGFDVSPIFAIIAFGALGIVFQDLQRLVM